MDWIFVLVLVGGIGILLISIIKGKSSMRNLFYFWIASFCFGPRALEIDKDFRLFFIEAITIIVFVLMLMHYNVNIFQDYRKIYPKFTGLLMIASIWAYYMGTTFKLTWGRILSEGIIFFMIMPTFYIVYMGFKHLNVRFDKIILVLALGGMVLAMVSVVFYFAPGLAKLLPESLVSGQESKLIEVKYEDIRLKSGERWNRGGASFWGMLLVSAFYATILFPIWTMAKRTHDPAKKGIFFGLCILLFVSVLIAGQRSVWLGVLFGFTFYALLKGFKGFFFGGLLSILLSPLLPHQIYERFFSSFDASQQTVAVRLVRYKFAWFVWTEHPILGSGWAGSGWVHNFVLQLGANMGTIGFLIFVLWLLNIFFKTFAVYKNTTEENAYKDVHLCIMSSFVLFFGPMIGESVINWSVFMIPFWFLCAVLYNYSTGNVKYEHMGRELTIVDEKREKILEARRKRRRF